MIRVERAPEPADFDEKVRQPGLSVIAELVGEPPLTRRPGRRRQPVAQDRDEIPPDKFPAFWTEALNDLLERYGRVCMYVSVYIERVTGAPSVDHMMPKSRVWNRVYEWDNYRLACSLMNSRKGAVETVLDPFHITDSWFQLELVGFQVLPGEGLDARTEEEVWETINQLGLNDRECRHLREEHAQEYWDRQITFEHLRKRSPFVARELARQRKMNEIGE